MNPKKNILVSIDWFLPGTNAGGPVTSIVNLIEQLDEFYFYIITSDTDYCATQPYSTVSSNEWVKHADNVQVYYFSTNQLTRDKMQAVIEQVETDTIYINGIFSKFFSRLPLKIAQKLKLNTIVASRGMLSPHGLAVKAFKKKVFLQLINSTKTYKNVHFHVTNLEEKEAIENVLKNYKKITAIPNFPRKIKTNERAQLVKNEKEVRLISLGRIAEEKGTSVGLAALKGIDGRVTLDLYGTIYNEAYWQKCKAIINQLPENVTVNYKGALPSNHVMHTLENYHFLLLPSKGENYGHAIVESLMANRPVVISTHTPWKNLKEKNIGFDVEEEELSKTLQHIVDMNDVVYNSMTDSIYCQIEELLEINSTKKKYIALFSNTM